MTNELITINFGKGATLKVKPPSVTILPEETIKANCVIMVNIGGEPTPVIVTATEYRRLVEIKEQIKIKESKMTHEDTSKNRMNNEVPFLRKCLQKLMIDVSSLPVHDNPLYWVDRIENTIAQFNFKVSEKDEEIKTLENKLQNQIKELAEYGEERYSDGLEEGYQNAIEDSYF